jgi:predicted solute-binding protein
VENIKAVVEKTGKTGTITGSALMKYLTENIDYDFNDEKKKGLKLFLELMQKL